MLSAIFVDRPRLAIVIAIVTTIAGLVALYAIPFAQYPDIVPPQVSVSTRYPGASAAVVDATIAQPAPSPGDGGSPAAPVVAPGPPFPEPVLDKAVYDNAGIFSPATIAKTESTIDEIEARSCQFGLDRPRGARRDGIEVRDERRGTRARRRLRNPCCDVARVDRLDDGQDDRGGGDDVVEAGQQLGGGRRGEAPGAIAPSRQPSTGSPLPPAAPQVTYSRAPTRREAQDRSAPPAPPQWRGPAGRASGRRPR